MLTPLAPTPSGYLHEGNIYNFLLNWLWARSNGGKVLLRIDDMDAGRKRPEYVEDIFRTLDWLGLDWDIGPTGPDNFESDWSQLHRNDLYNDYLNQLNQHECLFACICTRSQLNSGKHYPGICEALRLPMNKPGACWRIKLKGNTIIGFDDEIQGTVQTEIKACCGSFVVRRSDAQPAYQLCSLADDRYFGVTHIARGADLMESTVMQLYLDQWLKDPVFHKTKFKHHELLKNQAGEKLSKSAGTQGMSLRALYSKDDLLRILSKWMSLDNEINLQSLIQVYR